MARRTQLYIDDSTDKFKQDLSDFSISEKDKESPEYLMERTDDIITRLVDENSHRREEMFKMRDFYDGIRDPREYDYLESNFGIGNPSEIKFTPLIRNRIDTLIGLLSSTEFDYKLSITDEKSIFQSEQERTDHLTKTIFNRITRSNKERTQQQQQNPEKPAPNTPMERLVQEAKEESKRNWRNLFVESAINFIEDARECPVLDLSSIRELIFEDISVVGEGIYRTLAREVGVKPKPEVLLPENCYYVLRRDQRNVNEAREFVYVRYMSKQDVLQRYGHLMNKDEKEEVLRMDTVKLGSSLLGYMSKFEYTQLDAKGKEQKRRSAIDRYSGFGAEDDVVKVFETEWIANNDYDIDSKEVKSNSLISGPDKIQNKRNRQDRYRSVRIGDNVYVDMGKDLTLSRYDSEPDKARLSFNGVRYSDRGGEPYSILWKCKDIQDMHDILLFHRDNLISNSGVRGVSLDFSKLPEFLGDNEMERVMKALALLKQGVNLADSSQEGAELSGHSHGTYDMTVNGESLNAINETLRQLDEEATKITGVTPQMMGAIEQREAVSNVKTGINQSSLTLKKMYDTHDRAMKFLLTDMINAAKYTLKDGYKGSYKEGNEVFTIIPKYFSFTNYRIQIINSSQEKMKLEEAKALIHEGMATGSVPWDVGVKVVMLDNPHEIIELASEVAARQTDLAKQLEQTNAEREELQKQVEKLTKELERVDQAKMDLEKQKLALEREKANAKASIDKEELDRKRDADSVDKNLKDRQLDLEEKQLYLSSNEQMRKIRRDIV